MPGIALIGSASDLGLAGLTRQEESGNDTVTASFGPDPAADIVFSRTGAIPEGVEGDVRVVATAEGSTWRRSPWPVNDDLFELEPPRDPHVTLLVGGPEDQVEVAAAEADRTGASPRVVEELTPDDLEAAATVIFIRAAGEPFPPAAFAVGAAGRLLLMTRMAPIFGLLDGIDHLASDDAGALGRWAGDAARQPDAFGEIRTWGRNAAERHRATVVYPRFAADFRLGL